MTRTLVLSGNNLGTLGLFGSHDFAGVDKLHLIQGYVDDRPYFNVKKCYHAFLNNKTLDAEVLIESNIPLGEEKTAINAAGMFDGCSSLETWPVIHGNAMMWTQTQAMFKGCAKVKGRFRLGGNLRPEWCQQMFMGCDSWDGEGINGLSYERTFHQDSMSHLVTGVPLSEYNLEVLLKVILDTTPEGRRNNVNVGCGFMSAKASRLAGQCRARGIEIVHTGTAEEWDDTFATWVAAHHDERRIKSLDFSDLDIEGQFTSAYNGCLVTQSWGVFAAHYTPPVGFTAVTGTGERLVVKRTVKHPGSPDLVLAEFTQPATTRPVLVWSVSSMHPYINRGSDYVRYLDHPCLPVYARDQREQPWLGELTYFSDLAGAAVGPNMTHLPKRFFTQGDSGSVVFSVDENGRAMHFSCVTGPGGQGSSFAHEVEWIESVTGERVRLS